MSILFAKDLKKADIVTHIVAKNQIDKIDGISKEEATYVKSKIASDFELISVQDLNAWRFYVVCDHSGHKADTLEKARGFGNSIQQAANKNKNTHLGIADHVGDEKLALAIAEGAALGNYQFLKYLKEKAKKKNSLQTISVSGKKIKDTDVSHLNNLVEATCFARELVNEPVSFLNAEQFALEMEKAGKKAGYKTTILRKKEIEQHKMGGLIGVNRGSIDPPTFTVMEYKPRNASNKKPIVLVGKGVVFDTGGLSLKPTPGSMDEMKCDMAGGAAVAGVMYAVAANKLPVHVIGLVPATDNRPGMNALAPQDIITISDGTTVEVLNTDAEGRLILADALVYAKKYKPELCIDLATLTGAAVRAIGSIATAAMGTADEKTFKQLEHSAMHTWERIVQFPMWTEYGDEMKSDIADLKNLGSGNAGQITAAKFLEHFTDYPWIHLDIAGPAYINGANSYRTKGGTGVGVRMLYHFIQEHFA